MSRIKSVLIRLDLENPEHKQAYEYLQNKSKSDYKSNSDFIVKAVNAYGGEKPHDMEQVIKRCFAEVMADMEISRKESSVPSESEDIAWDFIGGDKPDINI